MELSVRYMLELRDVVGFREEVIDIEASSTVQDLLARLFERYPALESALVDKRARSAPRMRILVNGRDMRFLKGFETPLAPGDLVCVQPATR